MGGRGSTSTVSPPSRSHGGGADDIWRIQMKVCVEARDGENLFVGVCECVERKMRRGGGGLAKRHCMGMGLGEGKHLLYFINHDGVFYGRVKGVSCCLPAGQLSQYPYQPHPISQSIPFSGPHPTPPPPNPTFSYTPAPCPGCWPHFLRPFP